MIDMFKLFKILILFVGGTILIVNYQFAPTLVLSEFQTFKAKFGKVYKEDQEIYRKLIFLKNLAIIEKHNFDQHQTYWLGVNQFADLTNQQFIQKYLLKNFNIQKTSLVVYEEPKDNLRIQIDWISKGKVSIVKDQGQCAGSWAFSAIAAVQSAYLINGQAQPLFSEQQLMDCSFGSGNSGCYGGWMGNGFQYIIDKGITDSSAYPYRAKVQLCYMQGGKWTISNYTDINDCDNLLNSLAKQPISVAVDASVWRLYRGGVFMNCGKTINHGALLVGVTDTYWKIKNSWGTAWGQNGFIRIARGNTCGICSHALYPKI